LLFHIYAVWDGDYGGDAAVYRPSLSSRAGLLYISRVDHTGETGSAFSYIGRVRIGGEGLSGCQFIREQNRHSVRSYAGFFYCLFSLFGKKAVQDYDPWTIVVYNLIFGGAILTIVSLLWEPSMSFGKLSGTWPQLLFLVSVPTIFAYIAYTSSLRYIEASRAAIVANTEPVVGVLTAVVFLKEIMDWPQVLGVLIVMSGVLILQMGSLWRPRWLRLAKHS
jgi:uncharacterized membrane protein